jgi:hypothetical protein
MTLIDETRFVYPNAIKYDYKLGSCVEVRIWFYCETLKYVTWEIENKEEIFDTLEECLTKLQKELR